MAEFFCGRVPDILYHGSHDPDVATRPCAAAITQNWWKEIDWEIYDGGEDGEYRTAYANIAWEWLGLRDPSRADVPEWARDLTDIDELGRTVGIFFVTDDPKAASRYGDVHEIDMTSTTILDVVEDRNPGTYRAWMLLVKAGEPLPILNRAPAP